MANTTHILRIGNPILRRISAPVIESEFGTEALKNLIDQLFLSLPEHQGIGCAAPQLGVNKRVIVFGMDKHPEFPIQSTKQYGLPWSNDDNAYRLRKDNGMCQLYISVEE